MEIKYKSGDTITIPEGCKVIIKNKCVVFEKEQSFKDGNILVSVGKNFRRNAFIYKSTDDEGFHSYYVGLDACGQLSLCEKSSNRWGKDDLSYATEEEKQLLFDKMKKQGLQWNEEKKQVEKIRWRAKDGKEYYYVGTQGILMVDTEDGHITDKNRHDFYNYFHTKEQAEEAIKRIKETLEKFHEEIKE